METACLNFLIRLVLMSTNFKYICRRASLAGSRVGTLSNDNEMRWDRGTLRTYFRCAR